MISLPANLTSTAASTVAGKSRSQSELTTNDFLRLMTEQMKQQDPFAPTDNSQMVVQMAQMSATSATAEMNATLKSIAGQIADQTRLLASIVPATPATPAN